MKHRRNLFWCFVSQIADTMYNFSKFTCVMTVITDFTAVSNLFKVLIEVSFIFVTEFLFLV